MIHLNVQKVKQAGERPVWMNTEILAELRHKEDTQKVEAGIGYSGGRQKHDHACRNGVRKAKAQLVQTSKGGEGWGKKIFLSPLTAKGTLTKCGPVVTGAVELVTSDRDKAEVLCLFVWGREAWRSGFPQP